MSEEGQSWTVAGDTVDAAISDVEDHSTDVKMYRYITTDHGPKKSPPMDVNYETGISRRLYKQEYFTHGELDKVELYAETATGSNGWPIYSDLVLKEEMVYTRDSLGFAKERTTTITWYLENDAAHETTKVLHKPYSPIESGKEGITRRENVIDQLAIVVAGVLVQVLPTNNTYPDNSSKIDVGRVFMQDHKTAMDMFIRASKKDIVHDIKYATDFWLDIVINQNGTKVRDVIRSEVDIWGIWDSV